MVHATAYHSLCTTQTSRALKVKKRLLVPSLSPCVAWALRVSCSHHKLCRSASGMLSAAIAQRVPLGGAGAPIQCNIHESAQDMPAESAAVLQDPRAHQHRPWPQQRQPRPRRQRLRLQWRPPQRARGTTVSELRGTTVPFNSLQSAVSRNMLESLKVGKLRGRKSCEIVLEMSAWVLSPEDACEQECIAMLFLAADAPGTFDGAYMHSVKSTRALCTAPGSRVSCDLHHHHGQV